MRKQVDPNRDYLRQMGYETRDVSLGTLVKWVVGLFVFVGVISVIAVLFYAVLTPGEPGPSNATAVIPGARRPPPEPRVQGFPIEDMNKFRAQEEQKLTSYGWVNKDAGVVQIPVSRAVELTAQRGLKFLPESKPSGR